MVSKQVLREIYLAKRLTLSKSEWHIRNEAVIQQLIELIEKRGANRIHTFLPIAKKKEVNTLQLIEYFRSDPKKTFIIPKSEEEGELSHYLLNGQTVIRNNKWGVPEPLHGEKAAINDIDFVVVPLVIADKANHRIGYGKGYYDRFLKVIPNAYKVGVSLLPSLDQIPYVEANDVPLNRIVLPSTKESLNPFTKKGVSQYRY